VRTLRILVSIVCLLIGLVWIGQGLGWIEGSIMTGQLQWAVAGVILVGLSLLQFTLFGRSQGDRRPPKR
jgi:hypothetical protein